MPVNWSARRYTKEEFILAWEESKSIADVLRVLNIVPAGGNYQSLNSAAKELGLTKSHMTGQGWNKGGVGTNKGKELDLILVKGSSLSSHNIRKRLIKEGWKGARCEVCKLEEWMGASISLELDHINGDRFDNRIENLRILCPNCHAQTDTYRGKNKSRGRPSGEPVDLKSTSRDYPVAGSTPVLCTCGKSKNKKSKQCRNCSNKDRIRKTKIDWPSLEELEKMVSETSYLAVGKELGVSDNAVRKAVKRMKAELNAL